MQRGDNNLVSLPASTGCWMHSTHIQSDLDFFFFHYAFAEIGEKIKALIVLLVHFNFLQMMRYFYACMFIF